MSCASPTTTSSWWRSSARRNARSSTRRCRSCPRCFPTCRRPSSASSATSKLFVPHSRDQMFAGDLAYVVTTREQVQRTLSLFGHEEPDATRVVIAGGGNIGLYVAQHARAAADQHAGEDHRAQQGARHRGRRQAAPHGGAERQRARPALAARGRYPGCRPDGRRHQQRPGQHSVQRDGQAPRLPLEPGAAQQPVLSRPDRRPSASTPSSIRAR